MLRLTTILLLTLVLAFLALPACSSKDDADELLIYSPHGADIQLEFTRGFEAWHLQKYGRAVHVKFIDVGGGTGVIVNTLDAKHNAGTSPDADMMFGGGSAVFDDLARKGYLEPPTPPIPDAIISKIDPAMRRYPSTQPSTQPTSQSASQPTSQPDSEGRPLWVAATSSYFGIVINKQRAAELGIPLPHTWADVAGPQWFGNLSVADPSKSGSVKTCLEMVLQQYGWEKGWPMLVKMYANAQSVKPSGSQPADETASASAVGGIVIDFFGRIAVVKCGPDIAQFVVPEGGAQLDADPIAVLQGAKHKELASHMMEFVLSPAGQRLWTHRPGTPGGPAMKALGRLSVLRELYENESQFMTDPYDPFAARSELKIDKKIQGNRTVILGDLVKCTLIDNHDLLVLARQSVLEAGDPPDLLALFDALPFPATDLPRLAADYTPERITVNGKSVVINSARTETRVKALRDGWTIFAEDLFRGIIAKAKTYKHAH